MENFFIKTGENAQRQNKLIKKVFFVGIAMALIFVVGMLFLAKRSSLPSYRADQIPISFEELMPNVTHAQARANICGKMNGNFYDQICNSEFENIPKDDVEKLVKLFSIIENIKNDSSLSDYDRYFLGQLISVSLPTKGSPIVKTKKIMETISRFLEEIITVPRVSANELKQQIEFRDFDEQMARDFTSIIYDLPKGDNAWVINIMVSKYAWADGRRQPIYSEQFTQVFDPFPENSSVKPENVTYHLRSFVDAKSYGINESRPVSSEQTGVMVAYSFLMESWHSQGYGHDESVSEEQMETRKNFSEEAYNGTNHIDGLFIIMDEIEKSSPKIASRRNLALESRKNFNAKNRRVQTRPRGQASPSDQPSNLEDAYFGVNDGLMPRACEAILAKIPTWKRQTNNDGGIVPHGWEEFIKNGKNSGGVTDLGTCSTNIIFEEQDKDDMQISIRGFDVTRERNDEYQKASKDTKYVDVFYMPTTKDEIYEKWKNDRIGLERNQSAENNKFTDIFEGRGFVSTYYFDSDKEIPDPSIDSYALILSGKCVVSFSGFSWPIREGDLYEERIAGPQGRSLLKRQGRWSGLYGKYHYYEYSYDGKGDYVDREAINIHSGFDHGFEELHQKMVSFAPQIIEAIKPFCE